ncbi:MAG: DUF4234 domain-containing protein [Acholeplasmatales bacterium]|nr:DUF4234 domain-containing protein [Acholeplasmatales bacterium]
MTKRSIVTIIILSLITCGIYAIYWTYVTANELNAKDNTEAPLTNYIVAFLLGIITCGIYMIYWNYKFYVKADKALGTDSWIVNFILSILGLEIVSMALVQDSINKA